MKRWVAWTLAATLCGMTLGVIGCGEGGSSSGDATENFRLLVSDEANAIGDFSQFRVRISSIGLQQGGESETWLRLDPVSAVGESDVSVDLVPLTGTNALEIWRGNIPCGDYTKAFLYVEEAWGVLETTGEKVGVTVPSNKLQISKPFTVSAGTTTSFVYDITVVATGNEQSGRGYKLKPQIAESGPDQEFEALDWEGEDDGLQLVLLGDPGTDETVTLSVSDGGLPVAGAEVRVNDVEAGVTGADGTLELTLPAGDEIEIEAVLGAKEGELEIEPAAEDASVEWLVGMILAVTPGAENGSPWTVALEGGGLVKVYVVEVEGTPSAGTEVAIEGALLGPVIDSASAQVVN